MTRIRLGFYVVAALLASIAFPSVVHGQRSGVEIWSATCGNCHLPQPANRYTAKDWDAIATHMTITARLTDRQAEAVLEFLKSGAQRNQDDAGANAVTTTSQRGVHPSRQGQLVALAAGGPAAIEEFAGRLTDAPLRYQKLCAPCHGKTGRGDGPAAVALTPRPASFADVSFQAARSDEELIAVITDGKKAMPSFGKQLSADQIRELVAYLRELGTNK